MRTVAWTIQSKKSINKRVMATLSSVVCNIALLATISAPTSMAIEMAKKVNLTLASFCRGDGFVLYTE